MCRPEKSEPDQGPQKSTNQVLGGDKQERFPSKTFDCFIGQSTLKLEGFGQHGLEVRA
jgi:hypothetical protein